MAALADRLTVLHYTAATQREGFETALRARWLAEVTRLGLPLVVVAQRALAGLPDGTTQVVVGEVGASGFNMFRQVQIGLAHVTTPYVVSVEADCLYPPDYFTTIPDCETALARHGQTYLIGWKRRVYWHKPEGGTWAQVAGTAYYRDVLERLFVGQPDWDVTQRNFPKEISGQDDIVSTVLRYEIAQPCVSIKARGGMRHYSHSLRVPLETLPYWGRADALVAEVQPWAS